jgi:arginyl-tRNA--protein-N-Asp/Glu arginylyltransferase
MALGRPSEYDFKMCIEICSKVAEGYNIKTILKSKDEYPTFQTWCNWKREHNELFDLYIKTMQDKAEALEEEMDNYRVMLLSKEIDASTYNTLVQTLKWKMGKFYPKMFGDKIQQEHSGEIKGTNTTTLNITLPNGKTIDDFKL